MVFSVFSRLFQGRVEKRRASLIYTGLVSQARRPEFYQKFEVADTFDGRFDMILLHLFIVTRGLEKFEPQGDLVSRSVQEMMVDDMDRSLREMGVGDMSVGKKVKDMMSAWFGRRKVYEAAVTASKADLAKALAHNVYRQNSVPATAEQLAEYVIKACKYFDQIGKEKLLVGEYEWPEL